MKRRRWIFLIGCCCCLLIGGNLTKAESVGGPLEVALKKIPSRKLKTNDSVLQVTFRNAGKTPIRILNEFDRTPLPVFFAFHVKRKDGTPLPDIPGAGKADFTSPLKYVELKKNEEFSVDVSLHTVLPRNLEPGDYEVSVAYHNQYGENCFRGEAKSPPIKIHLEEPTK